MLNFNVQMTYLTTIKRQKHPETHMQSYRALSSHRYNQQAQKKRDHTLKRKKKKKLRRNEKEQRKN